MKPGEGFNITGGGTDIEFAVFVGNMVAKIHLDPVMARFVVERIQNLLGEEYKARL